MLDYMEVQFSQLGQAFVTSMRRKHDELTEDFVSYNTNAANKIAELGPRFTDEDQGYACERCKVR